MNTEIDHGIVAIRRLEQGLRIADRTPTEWSRYSVNGELAVALAWPAKPVDVAQPATRRSCDNRSGRIGEPVQYVGGEPLFVITAPRHLALHRAMLPERRTGAALGDMHDFYYLLDTGASTRGA